MDNIDLFQMPFLRCCFNSEIPWGSWHRLAAFAPERMELAVSLHWKSFTRTSITSVESLSGRFWQGPCFRAGRLRLCLNHLHIFTKQTQLIFCSSFFWVPLSPLKLVIRLYHVMPFFLSNRSWSEATCSCGLDKFSLPRGLFVFNFHPTTSYTDSLNLDFKQWLV